MQRADIVLERHGHRADIVLSRPGKRNSLTQAMWQSLPLLCAEAETSRDILVVVVRGAGGEAFSGGADIAEFSEVFATPESARRYNVAIDQASDRLAALSKPTIAQIEGPCVGGGCLIALSCDLRIASDTATFAITPAKLGLAYSFSATRRLVTTVGPSRAKDILFSGRLIDAPEALRIGLCDAVVPLGVLADTVADRVKALADVSQLAVRTMKRAVDAVAAGATAPGADLSDAIEATFHGEDFAEGRDAFLAKRKPRFTFR